MRTTISIIQIIIGFLLGITILLQGGGSGLGSSWGSSSGGGSSFRTRRGVEKLLLYFTIILAIAFFITSLASFLT